MDVDSEVYKKRLDSANKTIKDLLKQVEQLTIQNNLLGEEIKSGFKAKLLQDEITQRSLSEANERNNSFLEEIQRLRDEIKSLKG